MSLTPSELDETIAAAVATSVDTASDAVASGEVFVSEPVERVPAETAATAGETAEIPDAAVASAPSETSETLETAEAPLDTGVDLAVAAAEALAASEVTTSDEATPAVAEAPTEPSQTLAPSEEASEAEPALPPSRGSLFDRTVARVRSWF